jgi:sec-independent protein translocase protein TatA
MGFLDMGMMELLLILVVALMLWGPGRLPEIARKLGRMVRTLKKATFDLTAAVTKEIDIDNEKDSPNQTKKSSGDKTGESAEAGRTGPQRRSD